MKDLEITVTADGEIQCLAPDDLDLTAVGKLHVRRTSYVEFDNEAQMWSVVLADSRLLGWYATRREAIEAEVEHLNRLIDTGQIEGVLA